VQKTKGIIVSNILISFKLRKSKFLSKCRKYDSIQKCMAKKYFVFLTYLELLPKIPEMLAIGGWLLVNPIGISVFIRTGRLGDRDGK